MRAERWVPAAVALLSLAATLGAFWSALALDRERRDSHFERETARVVQAIERRMEHYEDALQAGVAALDVRRGHMDRDTWRRFADGLDLTHRYPGVTGIGLVARVAPERIDALGARLRAEGQTDFSLTPTVDTDEHLPILYMEPLAGNRSAIGLDLAHEAHRREGARAALVTGRPTITAPIVLVQDVRRQPGFLFFTPYRGNLRWPHRPDAFTGLVMSPFVVDELVEGVLGDAGRGIDVRMRDGDTVMHDEFTGRDAGTDGRSTSVTLPLYGRQWTLDLRTGEGFEPPGSASRPLKVLGTGLLIDAMIVGLFLSIARAQRALRRSADIADQLAVRTAELEDSNLELERFACVVSHDLKTPLRGIGDLAWYLKEDLGTMRDAGTLPTDVPRHLDRIEVQVRRMDALIDGILDYSGIGSRGGTATLEPVDVGELLEELADVHAARPGQIVLDTPAPVLETSRTRLEQVLGNLVGNAFKYHHAPDRALVRLSFEEHGPVWRIRVADNGPGIDPAYHERIFEIFQTLQPRDAVDSTGVGLAIVRRIVDTLGGSVRVESALGRGTTFVIDWPARALATRDTSRHAPGLKTASYSDANEERCRDLRKVA